MSYWKQKDPNAALQTVPQGKRLIVESEFVSFDMETFDEIPAVILLDIDDKTTRYGIPKEYFAENFEEVKDE